MHSLSDEELVARIQDCPDSDPAAFRVLVTRHQERVMANCRYLTRAPNDAEDLAQEVFAKAFLALDRFEGRSQFKTWLHRIKINHCLNYVEKKRGRTAVDVEDPALASEEGLQVPSQAERDFKQLGDRQRIAMILDSLHETLRIPLVLREIDGYSYQEIADQLNIGLSAAKMRIKRGREAFRVAWEAELEPATQPVPLPDAAGERERTQMILESLHETLRAPLVLRDVEGLHYHQIAERLGITLSAVKARVKRAREAFRAAWEELENAGELHDGL